MKFEPILGLPKLPSWGISLVFFSLFTGHSVTLASAESASPWVKGFHTTARLISGAKSPEAYKDRLVAGVHVTLEKGWKTYWRIPGDAGVPPHFDWSGSSNVKDLKVLWPAPKRLQDEYGTSIGYYDEVVFPVVIVPAKRGEPVDLNLKLGYAVCKDICIPAEATMRFQVVGTHSSNPNTGALLAGYLDQVPAQVSKTDAGAVPKLRDVKIQLEGEKPELLIDAVFAEKAAGRDLFIEAPNDYYLPVAEKISEEPGGIVRYRVDLTQADDPKTLRGKLIRFTLVSSAGHSEIEWQLN